MCVVCICLLPFYTCVGWDGKLNDLLLRFLEPHNGVYFKQTDQYLRGWGCGTPTNITTSNMQVGSLNGLEAINKLKDGIGNKSHNIITL